MVFEERLLQNSRTPPKISVLYRTINSTGTAAQTAVPDTIQCTRIYDNVFSVLLQHSKQQCNDGAITYDFDL